MRRLGKELGLPDVGASTWAAAALWDTIHEQAEHGVGVLVTTHNMREAEQCDRLLLMSQARLVAQGSQQDVVGTTTATCRPDSATANAARRAFM